MVHERHGEVRVPETLHGPEGTEGLEAHTASLSGAGGSDTEAAITASSGNARASALPMAVPLGAARCHSVPL